LIQLIDESGQTPLVLQPFSGFLRKDFFAFNEEKQEDSKFNDERKIVWGKMKILQSHLDRELNLRGFGLEGKVSLYWINYTKRRVTGIWVAYTHIKPYYMVCQLNCGIYKGGVFVGIEINQKARDNLNNVADFINGNKNEFLSYIRKLDPIRGRLGYADWLWDTGKISASDLDDLLEALRSEYRWFDLGEWYPKTESILKSTDFVSRIADIFELLFPLYLVFVGHSPVGRRKTDRLLRVGDVRKKEIAQRERELAREVGKLSDEEINEVITVIDKRNRLEKTYRQAHQTKTYRRNPILSLALKQKYKDKCQICRKTFNIERGFFCDTHHLRPLRAGGTDTSDNIFVFCPNHHRIFDRSRIEIISKNSSKISVKVDEKIFEIHL
jgi:hypothetical protein